MASTTPVRMALLPLRLVVATGVAFVGYYAPYVAGALLALASLVGVGFVVVAWAARRAIRARGRHRCATCGYDVLDIARICPKCRTPTPLALARAGRGVDAPIMPIRAADIDAVTALSRSPSE